jgi:hypothetical protein
MKTEARMKRGVDYFLVWVGDNYCDDDGYFTMRFGWVEEYGAPRKEGGWAWELTSTLPPKKGSTASSKLIDFCYWC